MITKLAFYDFDHTLFNSPHPEEGKLIWKEKTGEDWPHKGWWYEPESINPEVFDMQPYPSVVSKLNRDNADPNTYTVLLTGRMVNMTNEIKAILDSHGIKFDDYNLAKKPEESKVERIKGYLGEFPAANDVVVYDDREKELVKYKDFKERLPIYGIDFEIQKAENGKLSLVESIIFEEIEKKYLNEGVNMEKIRNFVATFKNKDNVVKGIIKKLGTVNNYGLKKYLLTILLLSTFGHKIGNADNVLNSVSEKLTNERFSSVKDFVLKTRGIVKQDETLIDMIKPLIPQDAAPNPDALSKNDMIKMGLIDGVFEVDEDLISKLAGINKNRFTSKYLSRYNSLDDRIEKALHVLRDKGETPNYSLIKAIIMIESGMIPRKNRLGFQGYPQTKWKYVKGINKKFGTDFTMKDLYDPERSAQFIHYYMKALEPLSYINDFEDLAASYNMGVGNYKKYLQGKRKMKKETQDYVALAKTMLNKVKSDENGDKDS